jgi:hypothetical protein
MKKLFTVDCPSFPPHIATHPFFRTQEANPERPFGSLQSVGMHFICFTLNSPISSIGTPYSSLPPITANESSDIGRT